MFSRVSSVKGERKNMGSMRINFALSFSKIALLYLVMKTMCARSWCTTKPHIYEIVIRDLIIFALNMRGYLISSYFTYLLTTIWIFLQLYERVGIVFVFANGSNVLKILYGVVSLLRILYNLYILVAYRSSRYIRSFHEFGSDLRLYRKCNSII